MIYALCDILRMGDVYLFSYRLNCPIQRKAKKLHETTHTRLFQWRIYNRVARRRGFTTCILALWLVMLGIATAQLRLTQTTKIVC